MGKTFRSKTEEGGPILGAEFFNKDGVSVQGIFQHSFPTKVSSEREKLCFAFVAVQPFEAVIEGKKTTIKKYAVGAMKGFEMALQANECGEFQKGDVVKITRIGTTKTKHDSDRIDFDLVVDRP